MLSHQQSCLWYVLYAHVHNRCGIPQQWGTVAILLGYCFTIIAIHLLINKLAVSWLEKERFLILLDYSFVFLEIYETYFSCILCIITTALFLGA